MTKRDIVFTLNAVAFITLEPAGGGSAYSRTAFIRGRRLFEGGVYSRAAFIRGRRLFEGGVYYFGVE